MTFRLEGLHDLEGRKGIIGRVEQLCWTEIGHGPVAGGDGFRFLEAQLQNGPHRCADADLSPVAQLAKHLIEIQDVGEGDSQPTANLSAIILQSKAHLEDIRGGEEIGHDSLALPPMQLEDEGFVTQGELHDVRAVTFLTCPKRWLGFGVKSAKTCLEKFVGRGLTLGPGLGNVDLIEGKSRKGG